MGKKVFEVEAVTVSPLYTGEVRHEERRHAMNRKVNFPVRKTKTNRVIIPFKGPLRAALEVLLRNKGTCDTGSKGARPCGRCITCSLFGSFRAKGRLHVDFLLSERPADEIVRTATHTRLDRERHTVSDSFVGEEVIEGQTFRGRIVVYDYRDEDLEYIKLALQFLEEQGLGGWITKGYGRMKFTLKEIDNGR